MNELMTGTLVFNRNYKPVISAMTTGLYEDTGWYTAVPAKLAQYADEFGYSQELTWGRKAGCSFVTTSSTTISSNFPNYFCSQAVASVGGEWKVCPYTEGKITTVSFPGYTGTIQCPNPTEACSEGDSGSVPAYEAFLVRNKAVQDQKPPTEVAAEAAAAAAAVVVSAKGTAKDAGLAAGQAANVADATTDEMAIAAAAGAQSAVWSDVKHGDPLLLPTAPAQAGAAAASAAAYVGAFRQQAALAAGLAAGQLKIQLYGPPSVGGPTVTHTSLQAGTEAAAATRLASGFARDAVWAAGLAAGAANFIDSKVSNADAPTTAAANARAAIVSLSNQPYLMVDLAANAGRVARLTFQTRGGSSAIEAGKAAYDAAGSVGATAYQQALVAGTEAGATVAMNPTAVGSQAGIQARIVTAQNGGKKKLQALMAGLAAASVGVYKRTTPAAAGVSAARAHAAAAARAAVPTGKSIPLHHIAELAVKAAGGITPHAAAAAGKAAGQMVMDEQGQKTTAPQLAGQAAAAAALAAGASTELGAEAAGRAAAALWIGGNTQSGHALMSQMAMEAVRLSVTEARGTLSQAGMIAGEAVGVMYSDAASTTATAASQAAGAVRAICPHCKTEAAATAARVAALLAMEEANVPAVVGTEAAQASMENGGTERDTGRAAAKGTGMAKLAMGADIDSAAAEAYAACKLQVYDVENNDLCYLAVATVVGEKLADDGHHPYEVGRQTAKIVLKQQGCPSDVAAEGAGLAIIRASLFSLQPVNMSTGAVIAAQAAGGDLIEGIKQAAVAIVTGQGGDTSIELQAAAAGRASAAAVVSIGQAMANAIATAANNAGGNAANGGTNAANGVDAAPLESLKNLKCTSGVCRPWCPFEIDATTKLPIKGRWGYCDAQKCRCLQPNASTSCFLRREWEIAVPFTFITGSAVRQITAADELYLHADSMSTHTRALSYSWRSVTPRRQTMPAEYSRRTIDLSGSSIKLRVRSDDERYLVLTPYLLEPCNVYEFEVAVTEAGFQYSRSNASVEVRVVPGAVDAYIEGGDRVVGSTLALKLDAKRSRDRDQRPGVQILQFVWGCVDLDQTATSSSSSSSSSSSGTGCQTNIGGSLFPLDLLGVVGDKPGELTIPNTDVSGLVGGIEKSHRYQFTVTVSADALASCYPPRSATASVMITLQKPQLTLPVVRVDSTAGKLTKVSVNQQLVLRGHVLSEELLQQIKWTQPTGNDTRPNEALVDFARARSLQQMAALEAQGLCCVWDNRCCMTSGEYSMNLVFPPGAMLPGRTYRFVLEAVAAEDSSRAEITIATNSPPVNGSITVRPSCGRALSTRFFASAVNWVDDAMDLPLLYRFAYLPRLPAVAGDAASERLLSPDSEQYWLDEFMLPEGEGQSAGKMYMMGLKAYISDQLQAVTSKLKEVRNLPALLVSTTANTSTNSSRTNNSNSSTNTSATVLGCAYYDANTDADGSENSAVDLRQLVRSIRLREGNRRLIDIHAVRSSLDNTTEGARELMDTLMGYAEEASAAVHDSATANLRQVELLLGMSSKTTILSPLAQAKAMDVLLDVVSSFKAPDILQQAFDGASFADQRVFAQIATQTLSNILTASATIKDANAQHTALVTRADNISNHFMRSLAGATDCGLGSLLLTSDRLDGNVLVEDGYLLKKLLPFKLEPRTTITTATASTSTSTSTSTATGAGVGRKRMLADAQAQTIRPSVMIPEGLLSNDGSLDRLTLMSRAWMDNLRQPHAHSHTRVHSFSSLSFDVSLHKSVCPFKYFSVKTSDPTNNPIRANFDGEWKTSAFDKCTSEGLRTVPLYYFKGSAGAQVADPLGISLSLQLPVVRIEGRDWDPREGVCSTWDSSAKRYTSLGMWQLGAQPAAPPFVAAQCESLRYGEYVLSTGIDDEPEQQLQFLNVIPPAIGASHHHWVYTPVEFMCLMPFFVIWVFFFAAFIRIKKADRQLKLVITGTTMAHFIEGELKPFYFHSLFQHRNFFVRVVEGCRFAHPYVSPILAPNAVRAVLTRSKRVMILMVLVQQSFAFVAVFYARYFKGHLNPGGAFLQVLDWTQVDVLVVLISMCFVNMLTGKYLTLISAMSFDPKRMKVPEHAYFDGDGDDDDDDDANEQEQEGEEEGEEEDVVEKVKKEKKRSRRKKLRLEMKAHLWRYRQDVPEVCMICQIAFEKYDVSKNLPCEHFFHKHCIDKWLIKNATGNHPPECPACKKSVACYLPVCKQHKMEVANKRWNLFFMVLILTWSMLLTGVAFCFVVKFNGDEAVVWSVTALMVNLMSVFLMEPLHILWVVILNAIFKRLPMPWTAGEEEETNTRSTTADRSKLPYGGSVNEAIKKQDRAAIREIFAFQNKLMAGEEDNRTWQEKFNDMRSSLPYEGDVVQAIKKQDREAIRGIFLARNKAQGQVDEKSEQKEGEEKSEFQCLKCDFVNKAGSKKCEICGTALNVSKKDDDEEDLELKEWLKDVREELRERMQEFRDNFDELFDEFDVNEDGIISFDEFLDGVRLVGMPMSEKDIGVLWDSIEATHAHGDMNFEEFEEFYETHEGKEEKEEEGENHDEEVVWAPADDDEDDGSNEGSQQGSGSDNSDGDSDDSSTDDDDDGSSSDESGAEDDSDDDDGDSAEETEASSGAETEGGEEGGSAEDTEGSEDEDSAAEGGEDGDSAEDTERGEDEDSAEEAEGGEEGDSAEDTEASSSGEETEGGEDDDVNDIDTEAGKCQ
eukprot:g533.t1